MTSSARPKSAMLPASAQPGCGIDVRTPISERRRVRARPAPSGSTSTPVIPGTCSLSACLHAVAHPGHPADMEQPFAGTRQTDVGHAVLDPGPGRRSPPCDCSCGRTVVEGLPSRLSIGSGRTSPCMRSTHADARIARPARRAALPGPGRPRAVAGSSAPASRGGRPRAHPSAHRRPGAPPGRARRRPTSASSRRPPSSSDVTVLGRRGSPARLGDARLGRRRGQSPASPSRPSRTVRCPVRTGRLAICSACGPATRSPRRALTCLGRSRRAPRGPHHRRRRPALLEEIAAPRPAGPWRGRRPPDAPARCRGWRATRARPSGSAVRSRRHSTSS